MAWTVNRSSHVSGFRQFLEAAIRTGPSCPIRPVFLDSADDWTNDALMSAVLPMSAKETHRMAAALHRNEERARTGRVAGS
ncbi:hypothetical protein SynA15127_02205 [Synechococcus sp. A15-127]|nr:hypothetical protein SynA15127_02205 [Synechococcus sp. A15-127]